MSNEQIIRAWKSKRVAKGLRREGFAVPANPAGSAAVSLHDIEAGAILTSPVSVCSIGPRCQCG
jgi:mersacidin/lichenicidin family type 2 lantibiotic